MIAAFKLVENLEGLSPKTKEGYAVLARKLENHKIGAIALERVTTQDVQSWLDSLGVSNTSKARYLESFKALLERWVVQSIIRRNPATGVKKPKRDPVGKRVLTLEEGARLPLDIPGRYRLGVHLALHGLRRGEVCAARRMDTDADGITVRRTITEAHGRVEVHERTKTGKTRWVPLDEKTRRLVEQEDDWLVHTLKGTPLSPSNFSRAYRKAVAGTEFEGVGLHDLRSSFATQLVQSGVDIRTVAEILGHSPKMLVEVYTRSSKEAKVKALRGIR